MSQPPNTYRLRADAARLLLAGMGFGSVYGYLPPQPALPRQRIQTIAELVQQGLVQNTGAVLKPEPGLHACLCCIGTAQRVFRLCAADAPPLEICIYPGADIAVAVSQQAMQPGQPAILRLQCIPWVELWSTLVEENERLDLPVCPTDGFAPLYLPPPQSNAPLPGEQFRLEVMCPDGMLLCRLYAMRNAGQSLLCRSDTGLVPMPYTPQAALDFLQEWKEVANDFG